MIISSNSFQLASERIFDAEEYCRGNKARVLPIPHTLLLMGHGQVSEDFSIEEQELFDRARVVGYKVEIDSNVVPGEIIYSIFLSYVKMNGMGVAA